MLVDVGTYQRITNDNVTSSDRVAAELADAQAGVDAHCHRTFEYASGLIETLDVTSRGVVYPKRRPVVSISSPAGATVREGGIYVGIWNQGVFPLSPLPAQSTVTYAGGYLPYGTENPTSPVVPVKLVRIICRIAWLAVHPVVLEGVPAGVRSVSVGDVSVSAGSGSLAPFIVMDASIEADLRGFVSQLRPNS